MFKFIASICFSIRTAVSSAYTAVVDFFFGKKEEAPKAEPEVEPKWENPEPAAPKVPTEVKEKIAAQTKEIQDATFEAVKGKNFSKYVIEAVTPTRVLTDEEMAAAKEVIANIDVINDSYEIYLAFEKAVGEENIHPATEGMTAQDQVRKGCK